MSAPPFAPDWSRLGTLFRTFARFSWISLLLASVLLLGSLLDKATADSHVGPGMLSGFLISTGLLSGLLALCGIPFVGRKGILWPLVVSAVLWASLVFLINPVLVRARTALTFNPLKVRPGAERIEDKFLRFSIDVPEGYVLMQPKEAPPGFPYAYERPGNSSQPPELFLIKALDGPLSLRRLKASDLPASLHATLSQVSWRGISVDVICIPAVQKGHDYLTYNVQIPLKTRAIQIAFGVPASTPINLDKRIEDTLASLEGATNW